MLRDPAGTDRAFVSPRFRQVVLTGQPEQCFTISSMWSQVEGNVHHAYESTQPFCVYYTSKDESGAYLVTSSVRILIVDDYEPWRRFVLSTVKNQPQLQVIGEASDGIAAVKKAEELQPDLILLDIGLPTLDGIKAAKRIKLVAPKAKILFVSQNHDQDVVREALSNGARGYVLKENGKSELLPAIEAIIRGATFISKPLRDQNSH